MEHKQDQPTPAEDSMVAFAHMGARAVLEGGESGTFAELLAFFRDDASRERICARVTTPEVMSFWA